MPPLPTILFFAGCKISTGNPAPLERLIFNRRLIILFSEAAVQRGTRRAATGIGHCDEAALSFPLLPSPREG